MTEEPRDFSLLDDEDEVTSSPLFDKNFNIGGSAPAASKAGNSNKNNPAGGKNAQPGSLSTFKSPILAPSPASARKFNISPNRPNQNSNLELKSIERPRSHSPLKMKGIEDYIQLHATSTTNPNGSSSGSGGDQLNKITMNLKMDDLLANVKNETSYQMLSDFSFMTGDTDNVMANNSNRSRKKSVDNSGMKGGDLKPFPGGAGKGDDEEDADVDDDDEEEDDGKGNLKYKFTAVYKKDEATGSFQEKSKTIFETKADGTSRPTKPPPPNKPPPPPLPTRAAAPAVSPSSEANSWASKPAPPPQVAPSAPTPTQAPAESAISYGDPESHLASILETLRNNSKKLDAKLDKIDDITPSSNVYYDSSKAADEDGLNKQAGDEFAADKSFTTSNENTETTGTPVDSEHPKGSTTIKKKNDSFFTDFLSKSDNLIAQTQNKLERLSKLETVNKPLAPKLTTTVPAPKVRPVASAIPGQSPAPPAPTQPASQPTKPTALDVTSTSIKDSKSLIDFKATDVVPAEVPADSASTVASSQPQQVDLLFDLNDQTFTLNAEPLKQGDSYFDLIGLTRSESSVLKQQQQQQQQTSQPPDLFKITGINELISSNSRSETPTNISHRSSPFKDDLLDNFFETTKVQEQVSQFSTANKAIIDLYSKPIHDSTIETLNSASKCLTGIQELEETSVVPSSASFNELDRREEVVPPIDILITEPLNEKDDDNIVPEGLFNLKHEIPKDQSRPHSPSFNKAPSPAVTPSSSLNNMSVNEEKPKSPATTPSMVNNFDLDFFINSGPSAPITPSSQSATPTIATPTTPTVSTTTATASIVRSRPVASHRSVSPSVESRQASAPPTPSMPKKTPKVKKKEFNLMGDGEQAAESSSSSSEEDEPKFQIRIRPKPSRPMGSSSNVSVASSDVEFDNDAFSKPTFVPLLPKPPKSVEEIEEFRKRRLSSDGGSITRSIKDGDSSEEESNEKAAAAGKDEETTKNEERKDSVHSEYNLELPDEDDLQPLNEFHDKYELTKYSDGTYGLIVLVRQPFRSPNVMYKNALQKITEVRSWTEYLVRLVDASTPGNKTKKLEFYNAHELITIAGEHDTTIERVIQSAIIGPKKEEKKEDEAGAEGTEEGGPAEPPAEPKPAENLLDIKKIQPFHEIELKASYKFSELCLQQFDTYTKIHTFKIQEIIFKEMLQIRPDRLMALPERFLKRFTKPKVTSLLDHTPLPFEICKFAHMNFSLLRSFLLLLQDTFWELPTVTRKVQREQQLQQIQTQTLTTTQSIQAAAASIFSLGTNKQVTNPTLSSITSSHTREEITVKVVDEYKAKLDKECRIIEHKCRTRVYLITFLNAPDPIIEIGLNDCLRHGKEVVGRYDIIPIKTEQWISPELYELNENVLDKEEFDRTHGLKCIQMPDNLLVEIMRYRTRPRRNFELPLQVRCYMSMVGRRVEIRIECTVAGTYYTKLNEVHCEDIQIRFPLPDAWVYLFRVEKRFRYGAVHSTKTNKFGKIKGLDRLKVHKTASNCAIMEASCGMAKYEQAFKSLVWRIEQLPAKNKDIYKTHMFICKLTLQEYDQMPENYEHTASVQYSLPICAASKSQVRSVSVNTCDEPPEKWVKLKSKFDYELAIEYVFDQKELPTVDKEKVAELQHLTQTESEGDNNEEDDVDNDD